MYESYGVLRLIVVFSGIIGVIQSLAWIGMTIIGIMAHHCALAVIPTTITIGTLMDLTIFQMYFKGDCDHPNPQNIDWSIIETLVLLKASTLYIIMWVYLVLNVLWIVSSISLLTKVRHYNLEWSNKYLYSWTIITLIISGLDLAFGVLFGLDYDTIHEKSIVQPFEEKQSNFLLLAAQSTSLLMMCVALKGFVLWLLNFILSFVLILEANKMVVYFGTMRIPVEVLNTRIEDRRRIDAFTEKTPASNLWITPPSPKSQNGTKPSIPDRYSSSQALFEERKRHYELQQKQQQIQVQQHKKHEPSDHQAKRDPIVDNVVRELTQRNSNLQSSRNVTNNTLPKLEHNYPDPDYSPTIPRAAAAAALERRSASRSGTINSTGMKTSKF